MSDPAVPGQTCAADGDDASAAICRRRYSSGPQCRLRLRGDRLRFSAATVVRPEGDRRADRHLECLQGRIAMRKTENGVDIVTCVAPRFGSEDFRIDLPDGAAACRAATWTAREPDVLGTVAAAEAAGWYRSRPAVCGTGLRGSRRSCFTPRP